MLDSRAPHWSNSFLKLAGNKYCSKLEKEVGFEIIYTPNMQTYLIFLPRIETGLELHSELTTTYFVNEHSAI